MKNIKKEKLLIATIIIAIITILPTISKAGMQINGGTAWVNVTVSQSYQLCQDLKNSDSTLGSNSLDPHLTLNKDWGAVAYLSLSQYGTVTTSNGPMITVDGKSRYTTTGNATGVLDFGVKRTQTSSLMGGNSTSYTSTLKNNLGTKYVENLPDTPTVENTKGQAFYETKNWNKTISSGYPVVSGPVGIRFHVIGFDSHDPEFSYDEGDGKNRSHVTFRPVIWN